MFLKQSTAYTFRMGPFLDETDGKTAETGLTISQADVRLSKGGGNFAQKTETTAATHDEIGYYIVLLDATDTATVGELLVAVHESGALPVFKTFQVVEEAIYDAIYGGSADLITKVDAIDTVVDAILVDTATTIPATIATIDTVVDAILVDTGTTLDGKIDTIDGIVDAILVDTGTTIPATIATVDTVVDAILVDTGTTLPATLDTIDNFLDTEIAAILADTNELQGDWVNGGRLDLRIDTLHNKIDVVDALVDLINSNVVLTLNDTSELQADWVDGGRLDLLLDSVISKVDVVDGIVDDILVDTGTTIPATIATIDTVVDSILVDTSVIGALGAGLTGVPWNAAWDTEVQSEVADGLAAYDPPTKAELDSAFTEIKGGTWASTDTLEAIRDRGDAAWITGGGSSAAAIADAVWDEATSGHVAAGSYGKAIGDGVADWITATGFNTTTPPTVSAIADSVWDESSSAHVTVGTFGHLEAGLVSAIAAVDTVVDSILVDTGTTIPATIATVDTVVDAILVDTGTTLDGKIDTIDGIVDSILVDTGTTIPATLTTIDDFLDTEIAAILADTGELQTDWVDGGRLDLLLDSVISKVDVVDGVVDTILVDTAVIGALGAGLTGIPWNVAWDTEVQSEVADALAVYDPPTKAEVDTAFTEIKGATWATTDTLEAIRDRGDAAWTTGGGGSAPTAAAVADAVWDEATSGHTTSGTFGEQVKTDIDAILVDTGTTLDGKIDVVDGIVDSILVDTGTTLNDKIDVIDGVVDAILVDTGTTLDGKLDTIDNFLDTEVAAILADTNELQTDWANGGRLDALLDSAIAKIDVVDGVVDSILVDTGTTIPATIATIDTVVDAILVDTGTTLDGKLNTIDDFLDTEVAAILADTNELQADWVNGGRLDLLLDSVIAKVDVVDGIVDSILVDTAVIGVAGAGLSGVPWNAAWDAEVQSECADALAAYDPPTKAEMDAMWTTAATESYASDGAAATPAQLLYMILCSVSEFAISSTTITGKKIDGATTAMTWTLDDATSPTSRTRAS